MSLSILPSISKSKKKTRQKYLGICLGLILVSVQAVAQQAPTGHAAVWQRVQDYWSLWAQRDLEGCMKFYHAGYSGWFHEAPAHRRKRVTRQWLDSQFKRLEVIFYEVNAIDIKIHDQTAIVHYYISSIQRDTNGREYQQTFRRTDHLLREEEQWTLIAHHDSLE